MVTSALKHVPSIATTAAPALSVSGVSHGFSVRGTDLPVLETLDFRVEPGSFVALLGPSGCGKSTLLRLVAGLDQPNAGVILEDGAPITRPHPSRVFVLQDPTLYPWRTVWRHVALGLEAQGILRRERGCVDAMLEKVGLDGFADAYPQQLSGGMAQRVALARALVNDPHLLILDEPFGRLDSLTRLAMQSELVRLWQGRGFGVLLVTHDVEEALFLADRVLIFSPRPARVVADLAVDLPRPRHRGAPALAELRRRALEHLGLAETW